MITIEHPASCLAEREYIFHVLLHEILGLQYTTSITETQDVVISSGGKSLVINDSFFPLAEANWLQPESLPPQPLLSWDSNSVELNINLVDTIVPVIYGTPVIKVEENICNIGIDIFGSSFFMLSRYEEAVLPDLDKHDRFSATASLAYRCGFLDRPLVNEYLEILWALMQRIWPEWKRKLRQPRTLISADVDNPYDCGTKTFKTLIRSSAGDLIKRHSVTKFGNRLHNYWRVRQGDYSHDPYLSMFDWMMDMNEAAGNRVSFYFIAGHSVSQMDGCYDLDEPVIRNLMRRIHNRGHEIGLHGSYDTYRDEERIFSEAANLRRILEEEGIQQKTIGCRQHYLRWATPDTARHLDAASFTYDTTLSFADHPGFRCGTCYEFPMYDLEERRPLTIRQRPLVVMECSVIDERYLGLGYSDRALELMQYYKHICHRFAGDFTLLWHNCHFMNSDDKRFYQKLIQ